MTEIQANVKLGARLKLLAKLMKSPAFIIFIICLGLLSYNLVAAYHIRPFNSDDVFWQTILQTWQPFNGNTVTLGNSSVYVDKLPYFAFFDHFFEPSRKILFVQSTLAAIAGFSAFYWSCLYFLKKASVKLSYFTLLPFAWLASFGYSFSSLYLNPNWRGLQLGISFAAFAAVAALWYKDIGLKSAWSKLGLVLVSAYAGLQIYSDPYFLYFTIGPIAILSLVLFADRKTNKRQLLGSSVAIFLSLVFAKLSAIIATVAGIQTTTGYPMQFIQFDNIATSFTASIHSILIIFSADFFGLKLTDIAAFAAIINFVLLCYAMKKAYNSISAHRGSWAKISVDSLWRIFFVGVAILIFLTHTFSTLGIGTTTYRYFLMMELLLILIFALSLGSIKNIYAKYSIVGLIVTAVVLNIALTALGGRDAGRFEVVTNRANYLNYEVIDSLESKGFTKGYANYWDANISTYLADSEIALLPSVCNGQKAEKWHWLRNDDAFDKKAGKSFYFVNPDEPSTCAVKDLIKQFGKPQETIRFGNKTMLLYGYDITSKMQVAK